MHTDECTLSAHAAAVWTVCKLRHGRADGYRRKVLGLSSGIDDPGGLQWELALSLLVVWVLVYFCVWKGIKSSGKVVYFTGASSYLDHGFKNCDTR